MAGLFTAAARRHIQGLRRALAPHADRLNHQLQSYLRSRGWNAPRIRSALAITPSACSRVSSLPEFLQQVDHHGRRLARLTVSPKEAWAALAWSGRLIDSVLDGRFEPAREQLHLATRLVLDRAFYEVRAAESQALFALARAEVELGDLDDLLRRFVEVLVETFGASCGWLVLLETGIQQKPARPRYFEAVGAFGSVWSHPFGRAAVLQLGFPRPRRWLPRERALLAAAAVHCQEALERSRLEREVRRLEAESHHAEEEERHRIGRELHDEAGQALVLLRLELEMIERVAPDELCPRLAETRELAARTAVELRRIVAALSPSVLERLGLEAALRQLTGRFRKVYGVRVGLRFHLSPAAVARPLEEVVYRVAQESLNNIARHSRATRVNLDLQAADKSIKLSVTDNGAGFCADRVHGNPQSFGLAGMRERAALWGGTLTVASAPGKGTRVTLELPLPPAPVVSNGQDSCSSD